MRDYNKEFPDLKDHKYMSDFDYVMRQYMMRSFSPYFISGACLEIGSYKGDFTELLSAHFDDLTVVEASSELAEITKERLNDRVKVISSIIEDVSLERNFENVFLIHTLEHMDNPIEAITKCKELLTDKGRFFVAVPNAYAASRQIAVKMGLIPHLTAVTDSESDHGHRCTYTFDILEKELRESGLKPIVRGGLIFKALSNHQFDSAMSNGIISESYIEGCYQLGMQYPELCASIYMICEKSGD